MQEHYRSIAFYDFKAKVNQEVCLQQYLCSSQYLMSLYSDGIQKF